MREQTEFNMSDEFKKRREFLKFHNENPQVYKRIIEYCEDLWAGGWRHYSIRAITYAVRYSFDIQTGGDEVRIGGEFRRVKMNNNHCAYYARMIVSDFPKFKDFFEFRRAEGEFGEGDVEKIDEELKYAISQ